ncbi:hypothetical protein ACLB2K_076025 [Fragaria x ananassa]
MVSSSSGRLRRLCSLDNDVIVSILSKLPVKSLLRFRCVCKSWRALISDPSFARMHMSSKSSKLLLGTSPLRSVDYEPLFKHIGGHVERTRELDYPVMIPTSSSKFFGSFNGLICLSLDYDNIILWNSCTGDSKLLPKPATFFHNNNESSFYGFGYDSTTKDYKVVGGSSNHNTVEGCLLNEALHWVHVDLGSNGSDSITGLQIVSFDLAEETLQVMVPFPHPLPVNQYYIPGIGTMANCLTLYTISRHNGVSIWVMKEYGVKESWIEVIRIPLEVLPTKVVELKVGLHCEECIKKILKAIKKIEDIETYDVDTQLNKVIVTGNVTTEQVIRALEKIKKTAIPWDQQDEATS